MKKTGVLLIALLVASTALNIYNHIQINQFIEEKGAELKQINLELSKVREVFDQAEKIKHHIKQRNTSLSPEMQRDISYAIIYEAECNSLEPELVAAVADIESRFNPSAKSKAGAIGIMQLMTSTWKAYGEGNVWSWRDNLSAGCKYLSHLTKRFGSENTGLVLASYNAGPSRSKCEINRIAGRYAQRVSRCRDGIRGLNGSWQLQSSNTCAGND